MNAAATTTGAMLARQVSLYGFFTILRRGLSVALTPLYTHYLAPSDYGVLEILNLSAWLVSIIGACKVDAAFYRYYVAERTDEGRERVLGASLLLTFIISGVLVFAATAGMPWMTSAVSQERQIPATDFYLVGAATWLDLATLVPLAYCRITDRVWLVGLVSITQALVSGVLAVVGVVGLGLGYRAVIVANFAAAAAAALICVGLLLRTRVRFTLQPAGMLLKYGLPMVPGTFFMYVIGSADRFFLARFAGLGDVGIYAVAAKFALGVNLVVMGPFGEMWGANQYRLHASGDHRLYQRTALAYLAVLFQFTLAVAYFSYDFVILALGADYRSAVTIVPILVFGVAIWGIVPTLDLGMLVVPGKTWIRSAATGAAALANVACNFLLVPRWGAQGAAMASVAGFCVLAGVTGVLSYPLVDMRVPLGRVVLMTATLAAATTLALLGPSFSYGTFLALRVGTFVAAGVVLYQLSWRSDAEAVTVAFAAAGSAAEQGRT
jgi:O-antigen/teichoic acid export membrane protein